MKRFYLFRTALIAALILGFNYNILAQSGSTYTTPGFYTYSVTAGVTLIAVDVSGAQGGNYSNPTQYGGKGGRVTANLTVTPGQSLYIYVGQQAGAGNSCTGSSGGSSYGGGEDGGSGTTGGCGGAGAGAGSDIRTTAGNLNTRLIVGGGGGGSSYDCGSHDGGAAAYPNGAAGVDGCGYTTGQGGTQSGGGSGGPSSGSGGLGVGGAAYPYNYGGGGGGGYYGGGGSYSGSGGGGSSFAKNTATSVTYYNGYNTGNGIVKITPLVPTVSAAPASLTFGPQGVFTRSVPQFTVLSGYLLSAPPGNVNATITTGFLMSLDGITWVDNTSSLNIPYATATLAPVNLYVQFNPQFATSYTGHITIGGGGQPSSLVIPLSGLGTTACASLPTPGTASSSVASASVATPITLSLAGTSTGGGIGYQWQSSPDSIVWTDINGAVTSPYSLTGISAKTWFRAHVTCPASGTTTSNAISVTYVGSSIKGNCTPTFYGYCSGCAFTVGGSSNPFVINGEQLTKVNDNTAYTSTQYHDLTSTQSVIMQMGNGYTGTSSYSDASGYALSAQIWIDFNNNGTFDATESVGGISWSSGNMPNIPISIPATGVTPGSYRMRVIVDYACCGAPNYPSYPGIDPCGTSIEYGDARDYTAIIIPPSCTGTPSPGIAFIATTTGCGVYSSNFYNVGETAGVGNLVYNWQSSPDNTTWGDISGATTTTYTQLVSTTLYYRERVTCTSVGGGTATTTSTKVNYNIQPAAVTGRSAFCSTTPAQMSDATPGGSWGIDNPAIASISSTGLINGINGGTATISYSMPSGCTSTKVITVNLSPTAITGSANLCTTQTTALTDAIAGGVWSSSNATFGSVDPVSGVVTGIGSGSPIITYKIPVGGCYVTFPMSVNTMPAAVTGTASVCEGGVTTLKTTSTGGTWLSSNSFQASVSTTGLVTGIASGFPTISYMLPGGCASSVAFTVNPVPSAILGSPNACVGTTTALSDATVGGVWSSVTGSVATIGSSTGIVTGVASGSSDIIYTLTGTGCAATMPLAVNLLPAVFSITGGGGYCSGSGGTHIGLSGSATGVDYTLYQGSTPKVTVHGSTAGLDFGVFSAVDVYTVSATNPATTCSSNMSGSTNVVMNPQPVAYVLTAVGTGTYCLGGAGVDLTLSGSDAGVSYQVMSSGVPVGVPVAGTGAGVLDLGYQTGAGTYQVQATNVTTLCQNMMTGSASISVNTPPTMYSLTGSGSSFCAGGTGIDISMSTADAGIEYDLKLAGVTVGSITPTVPGMIDFGSKTAAGTYTVVGKDPATGCMTTMAGSVAVSVIALPTAETVTGGGAFCNTGSGRHIGLLTSETGITYTLLDPFGGIAATVPGSSTGIDFGSFITTGTYTVNGINSAGCSTPMTGTATITVNPLPNPYSVSGGGGYCAGSKTGDTISLSTDPGIHYQLFNGGSTSGLPKTGTGSTIYFTSILTPGTYSVIATNGTTGCTNVMPGSGSITVSINSLPDVYTVGGGGGFCASDPGADVTLSNSETGVTYNLIVNGVLNPAGYGGVSGLLDFGFQGTAGTYTVTALNTTTSCVNNMNGSATVFINPLPTNYDITGAGAYCASGAGVSIGDSLSTKGVDYILQNSGVPVGSVLGGTGSALNFGIFPAGIYTIEAVNSVTSCKNTGSALTVTMNALPMAYDVTGSTTFCSSDSGAHVYLGASDGGVNYQLYNGSKADGAVVAGGSPIDFGLKTGGTYTVVGIDTTTKCSNVMAMSAVLNETASPKAYAVLGGGSRCAAGAGDTVSLSGSQLGLKYEVYIAGVLEGSFYAGTGAAIYLGAHTSAGKYNVVATDPSTGCTTAMTDSATVTVRATNIPWVSITRTSDTVCSGAVTMYTAVDTNGGATPSFEWKVNGTTAGAGPAFSYVPASGDIVSVKMTSKADCPMPAAVTGTTIPVTINPSGTPVAVVSASASSVCPGKSVTFTAAPTFPGSTPSFAWIENGKPVGTNSATYTSTPTDSVIVFCQYVSSYECATTHYVLSNNATVSVNEPVLPIFTIGDITSRSVNTGQPVTLKAIVTNTSGAFTYQWFVHGSAITGQTNPTFTYNYYNDQEVVKCEVTSVGACGGLTTGQSTLITVHDNTGVAHISKVTDLRVIPNPNKGAFVVTGTMSGSADQEITLEITNMIGQVVYTGKTMTQNGVLNGQVQLNAGLANGMYLLNVRTTGGTEVFHFVLEQ